MDNKKGYKIHIQGIVQGVGFRPFIYSAATKYNLSGWVKNTSNGVYIEVDGVNNHLEDFISEIKSNPPPLAVIDDIKLTMQKAVGYQHFEIVGSSAKSAGDFIPISIDVSVCADCFAEMYDPNNRRYLYPFINCTNCGPRFTIINDIPYDRPSTTMAGFKLCKQCTQEYLDPLNRRFHAQPIACPDCGPHTWLEYPEGELFRARQNSSYDAILAARKLLSQGKILAIKGLGGFHLVCDAKNSSAVSLLRKRKLRVDKPFAVMIADKNTIGSHCYLNQAERNLLDLPERPIVILARRPNSSIVPEITPNQNTIGVMLPYTPLHFLLFDQPNSAKSIFPDTLVMTSGNISEEPIAFDNEDAKKRLSSIADGFLLHDRPIHIRCDDSVTRVIDFDGSEDKKEHLIEPIMIRRARGYTPNPIRLPWNAKKILSVGAELKNTFCLTRDKYAFISQYIGDMQNYETYKSFEDNITHFENVFQFNPEYIVCDMHPDYLTSQYAQDRAGFLGIPLFEIQHHHAHIASVMAENQINNDNPVIGLAFDGTGYGTDRCIWGGEFFIATYQVCQRKYHLKYVPLPGGDFAIKQPSKIGLAYLWSSGIEWYPELSSVSSYCEEDLLKLKSQLIHGINTPLTSSMGRLFDAVSSIIGICQSANYEAQAAIELEAEADPNEISSYRFTIEGNCVDYTKMLEEIVNDMMQGVKRSVISARFHNTVINSAIYIVNSLRDDTGIETIALSGGVWQNVRLLKQMVAKSKEEGFNVIYHHRIPTNDSGISFGQSAIAHHLISN